MAGSETLDNLNLPNNLMKCGICEKVYSNPQQLECLHSFCQECICQYINDREQVKCPRCEQFQGLSQKKNDGLIQAVFDLTNSHKEYSCEEHKIKADLFCSSCHLMICKACQTEKHDQCHVVPIMENNLEDLVATENTVACKELKEAFEASKVICKQRITKLQENMQARSKTSSEIATFFYNLKTKFIQHLTDQEQNLQDKLKKLQSENEDHLTKEVQFCKAVSERLGQDIDLLGCLGNTSASISQLRLMEVAKNEAVTCKAKMLRDEVSSVKFYPDEGEIYSLFGIKPCHLKVSTGDLVEFVHGSERVEKKYKAEDFLTYNRPTTQDHRTVPQETRPFSVEPVIVLQESETTHATAPPQPVAIDRETSDVMEITPTLSFTSGRYVKKCHTKLQWDHKSSVPVGMAWIDETRFLVVDRFNHMLKLITDDGELVSSLPVLAGEPWDIVYTSQKNENLHFCAVSVPTSNAILYVRISLNKVELFRTVQTLAGYCSLGHDKLGHALVCGVCPPFGVPAVHIINIDGAILKQFVLDGMQVPLFQYPRSIDVTPKGTIIVCDWKIQRLVFLRSDGLILGEYKGTKEHPLKEPIGTTLDGFGNLLVSDTATNSIQTISVRDRRYVGTLKMSHEIKHPREIAITHVGNLPRLAVAVDDHVLIFDLETYDEE